VPVKVGPFYAAKISAWLLNLPHGLHVDYYSQVLTEDDEPNRRPLRGLEMCRETFLQIPIP
jgi:hypothetical protein